MFNQSIHSHYGYSISTLLLPALRVLLGIPSQLSHDTALLLRGAHPAPRALNIENIPADSPFVLTLNHYDHPGLAAWWGAALIATTIAARRTCEPHELHMMMAREWWYPHGYERWTKQPLTNWFFGQVSKAYGTIRLPPVLSNGEFRGEGAIAIRKAMALTHGDNPQLVGLAPEGKTGDNLSLCAPPHGCGLFMLLLTYDRIPILPVGVYEDETQTLIANFGEPYMLTVPRHLPKQERDRESARQVMIHIGRQLPKRMWGLYCEDLQSEIKIPLEEQTIY